MKVSHVVTAFAVIVVAACSSADELTPCGGLLEGEHGSFRHSSAYVTPSAEDETQDNHEGLCMWILNVPNAGHLTLRLEELDGSDASLIIYPELREIASTERVEEVIHPIRLDTVAVGSTTVLAGDLLVVMIRRSKTRTVAFIWDSNHVKESGHSFLNTLSFVQSPNGTLSFQPDSSRQNLWVPQQPEKLKSFVWILKDLRNPSLLQLSTRATDQSYYCQTIDPDSIFLFSVYFLDSGSGDDRLVKSGNWLKLGQSGEFFLKIVTSSPVVIITGRGWLIESLTGNPVPPAGTELELSWAVMDNSTTTTASEPPTLEPVEIPTHIYFGSEGGLKAYDLVTSNVSVVMEGNITGVAYDPMSKKIFPYSSGREGIIRRANVDGSGAEIIFSTNMTAYGAVASLTVDRSTGNLYVVTADAFVLVCNTTTSPLTCAQIAHVEGANSPGSIALDPSTLKEFFSDSASYMHKNMGTSSALSQKALMQTSGQQLNVMRRGRRRCTCDAKKAAAK